MAELTVEHAPAVIDTVTLTLSEDEARATLRVLTMDSKQPYVVRQNNRAVYDVIEELEHLFPDEEF